MNKAKNIPVKKKRKKSLLTPSKILRICIVWCFVICIFLLSFPFLNVTFYIKSDMTITSNYLEADLSYATQKEIDSLNDELKKAIEDLQKKPEDEISNPGVVYNASVNTLYLDWTYRIPQNVNAKELLDTINKAKSVERNRYTNESIEKLNKITTKAQKCLGASVTLSQNALQLMFGGSIAESYGYENISGVIANSLFAYMLGIIDIFFIIYPYIDIGAVLTIFMYLLICLLTAFSIYAKQQEDYILKHPELEADFGEKHPHFVKALINQKALGNVHVVSEKEKKRISAKNAKKHNKK